MTARTRLRAFLIGASLPVVFLFYISVRQLGADRRKYSYENYTLIAPTYFGIWNAGLVGASLRTYLICGAISGLGVSLFTRATGQYPFTLAEWRWYHLRLIVKHTATFALLYGLTKLSGC